MSVNWNRLDEWLWRMDQLRQIVRIQAEASPYGCAQPGGQRLAALPSDVGNETGER